MKTCLITIVLICCVVAVYSENVEKRLEAAVSDLSVQYKNEHPDLVFKPNLAIIPLANNSELIKKHEIGSAITSLIKKILINSILFNIVEQDMRAKQIEELQFSLSGMTDSDRLDLGQFETVDYFLAGEITEISDRFGISIRLIDVETGLVVNNVYIEIKKDELIAASEEIKAAYVSPYGIGIELGYMPFMYLYGEMANSEGQVNLSDFMDMQIYLNYRVAKWLVVWGGLEFIAGNLRLVDSDDDGQIAMSAGDFTNVYGDTTGWSGSGYSYSKARAPYFSILLGAGYVWNISRSFNITFGASVGMAQTFIIQEYRIPSLENLDTTPHSYIITSSDIGLGLVRPLIKIQYFFTPRLAASLEYGFTYQFSYKPASRYIFQDGYYDEGYTIPVLYDLDPSVDPSGKPHNTDMTGHELRLTVGLYF